MHKKAKFHLHLQPEKKIFSIKHFPQGSISFRVVWNASRE